MTRELDAAVAEALGLGVLGEGWAYPDPEVHGWWHPTSHEHSGNVLHPLYLAHCVCADHALWAQPVPDKMLGHYPGCLEVVPFYSEDIDPARTMEHWIAEHGRWLVYARAMDKMMLDRVGITYQDKYRYVWAMLTATPEVRCLAFLAAMGVDWREENTHEMG